MCKWCRCCDSVTKRSLWAQKILVSKRFLLTLARLVTKESCYAWKRSCMIVVANSKNGIMLKSRVWAKDCQSERQIIQDSLVVLKNTCVAWCVSDVDVVIGAFCERKSVRWMTINEASKRFLWAKVKILPSALLFFPLWPAAWLCSYLMRATQRRRLRR